MFKKLALKYGENPHQLATWQRHSNSMLTGYTKLSLNDLLNINVGYSLIRYYTEPIAIVLKHVNIAGMALGESFQNRWRQAVATDTRAALNGLLMVNHPLSVADIREVESFPFDGIIATAYEKSITTSLRLLKVKENDQRTYSNTECFNLLDGTRLFQEQFVSAKKSLEDFEIHNFSRSKTLNEKEVLMAWYIACSVKTNSAVLVNDGCTVAVSAGHQDGITAIEHAIYKAKYHKGSHDLNGAVLAVDGNFPHEIPVQQITDASISTFVLPGSAANDDDLLRRFAMVDCFVLFSRERCFLH
ncbi:hypothetical protein ACFC0X_18535 [Paenibacillus chitinolyticus]|uniref:hypothetical protein n=1 Tax=Paenibacillus chitinolyticus TaxID=79263 RepID=UPI0035D80529